MLGSGPREMARGAIGIALVVAISVGCTSQKKPQLEGKAVAFSGNCEAPPRPPAAIELRPVFDGLEVDAPVALVQAPQQAGEASGRWFVADQHGLVHSFRVAETGEVRDLVTSDLRDRVTTRQERLDERGLLGLAVFPNYKDAPRLVLSYSGANSRSVFSSVSVSDGKLQLDSERVFLRVEQPFTNHNGGHVLFGPDGDLYLGLGDGGDGGDPMGNGQNTQTLLGSILRIEISSDGGSYSIPKDNPFVDAGGRPEIFAYGLRNPWRFSFDRETGELWVGDVGQDIWEEVTLVQPGANHGWNTWEGFKCFPPSQSKCSDAGMVMPVHAYRHPDHGNRSVTGGYVYRGSALPDLFGDYVFADYVTGEIWRLSKGQAGYQSGVEHSSELLTESGTNISSFAQDADGELYALDYAEGRVLKLTPSLRLGPALPSVIADTGCFDTEQPTKLIGRAIPYDIRVPFWSDGARKQRYLVLPEGASLELADNGEFRLPPGGMTIKNFFFDDRLFETRFFVRHPDGEFSGYGYAWDAAGKTAQLVNETRTEQVGTHRWTFPGRADCGQCHTAAAGRTLGLEANQLSATQAEPLLDAGVVEPEQLDVDKLPELDGGAPLEERARAYLHVNCSNCHRAGGPARGAMDLRYDLAFADTGLCKVAELGRIGTDAGLIISAGDAKNSVLYQRMTRRDQDGMPPLASHVVDEAGALLVRSWIESLTGCP